MPNSAPLTVTAAEGRRLVLFLNGLGTVPKGQLCGATLPALIERLGFVQVDSVRVVERAHHMILFAREGRYRPAMLSRLVEEKRDLFEQWTHDAAIIPTDFYRYRHHGFARRRDALTERFRKWHGPGFEDDVEQVLRRIGARGAVMARDFSPRRKPGAALVGMARRQDRA